MIFFNMLIIRYLLCENSDLHDPGGMHDMGELHDLGSLHDTSELHDIGCIEQVSYMSWTWAKR